MVLIFLYYKDFMKPEANLHLRNLWKFHTLKILYLYIFHHYYKKNYISLIFIMLLYVRQMTLKVIRQFKSQT